jgi:hypothetical protein
LLESLPLSIKVFLLGSNLLGVLAACFSGSLCRSFGSTFADVVFDVNFRAVDFTAVDLRVLVIYI